MMRNIGAVIAGLFVGMCVNMALIMLNAYVLLPMPEGMGMNNTEEMNEHIEMPLYLVVAWLAGNIEVKRRGAQTAP